MIVDQYKFGSGSFPPVIEDGNTVGWYLSDDLTTITKDGSDLVSVWADKLGSGHDLLQATPANQPLWVETDGVLFDESWMTTGNFGYAQPEFIYIVFRQITWINDRRIFQGSGNGKGSLRQAGGSPNITLQAQAASAPNSNLALNTFGIGRFLFNGASSKSQINETSVITGDVALGDLGEFNLGAYPGGFITANIQVKELILRDIADAAQDEQDIYNYLAAKYSI